MKNKEYDWAIIGGGVVGIVLSEILTREGHSVVLIEKNEKLAGETTRDFHEWIHTGSLYTLIPDNLFTLKFLLGAIDDLLEYYGNFERMNLTPTESGLQIQDIQNGWFNKNYIHFRFRIINRKAMIPWLLGIARAIFLIDRIKEHDWLRRRAGVIDPFKMKTSKIYPIFQDLLRHKEKFYDYQTPDFTTNSRLLLNDLLLYAIKNGLVISTSNEFTGYERSGNAYKVNGVKESFTAKNIVFSNGMNISKFVNSRVKTSYAPMAVIKNIRLNSYSFTELDYYPRNCINLLYKGNGIGLIGGISFSKLEECHKYIDQVIEKHKEYNPDLQVIHKYIGKKSEIILDKQPRNYLYHILNIDENVWGVIPGKFTLAFSIAPEFYRRVYKKNPRKTIEDGNRGSDSSDLIANTVWFDVINNKI